MFHVQQIAEILHASSLFVQKVFPYDLPVSQGTSVTDDGQTDRQTDDNHAVSLTVTYLSTVG